MCVCNEKMRKITLQQYFV